MTPIYKICTASEWQEAERAGRLSRLRGRPPGRLHPFLRRRAGRRDGGQVVRRAARPGSGRDRRRCARRHIEMGAIARRRAVSASLRRAAHERRPARRSAAARRHWQARVFALLLLVALPAATRCCLRFEFIRKLKNLSPPVRARLIFAAPCSHRGRRRCVSHGGAGCGVRQRRRVGAPGGVRLLARPRASRSSIPSFRGETKTGIRAPNARKAKSPVGEALA